MYAVGLFSFKDLGSRCCGTFFELVMVQAREDRIKDFIITWSGG